jgi:hypothetical protein
LAAKKRGVIQKKDSAQNKAERYPPGTPKIQQGKWGLSTDFLLHKQIDVDSIK